MILAADRSRMAAKKKMNWLGFALMTVAFWGLYGVFLHKGAMGMNDPQMGRYKAFLVVGIAYFLVAVLAPLVLLKASGASLTSITSQGFKWSLIAMIWRALASLQRLAFIVLRKSCGMLHPERLTENHCYKH